MKNLMDTVLGSAVKSTLRNLEKAEKRQNQRKQVIQKQDLEKRAAQHLTQQLSI